MCDSICDSTCDSIPCNVQDRQIYTIKKVNRWLHRVGETWQGLGVMVNAHRVFCVGNQNVLKLTVGVVGKLSEYIKPLNGGIVLI